MHRIAYGDVPGVLCPRWQFVNGIRNSAPSDVIEQRIEILNAYFT